MSAAMRVAYEEAVELWRADGNRAELANALYNYSFCFSVPVNPREAPGRRGPRGVGLALLDEALDLYRALGDERGQANVLWGMGNRQYFRTDPDAGVAEMTEALEIFRRVGDRTMEAWAMHMLGAATLRLGDAEASRGLFVAALRLFHESGDAAGSRSCSTISPRRQRTTAIRSGPPGSGAPPAALTASTGAGLALYRRPVPRPVPAADGTGRC